MVRNVELVTSTSLPGVLVNNISLALAPGDDVVKTLGA